MVIILFIIFAFVVLALLVRISSWMRSRLNNQIIVTRTEHEDRNEADVPLNRP